MRYCKKCVQPDTRPRVYFDENGVCGACLWEEEKKTIDWQKREAKLREIIHWAKEQAKERGGYDCVVGVSGGKDSTFASLYARDKLGLNCLLVNAAPAQNTEIGKHNIDNLLNLNFDMFTIKVKPESLRKLIKRDFYKYLNISKPTEFPLWASVFHVALAYNIPLIVQGENEALTLGARGDMTLDDDASQVYKNDTLAGGNALKEYSGYQGIEEKDLFLYQFPEHKLFARANIRAIWLQYYVKEWSQTGNAKFSMRHGIRIRDDSLENLGRIHRHSALDSDFHPVNQLFKYVKFGFGFATDEACYDIRDGRLTREEGFELVKKYDGLCGQYYIKKFCDYIDITLAEFWRVVESFRNKELFEKVNGRWKLKSDYK